MLSSEPFVLKSIYEESSELLQTFEKKKNPNTSLGWFFFYKWECGKNGM